MLNFSRVLQGITILRLICDHGKELLKQEQLDELEGSTADEPVDLENLPEVTKKRAYEHLNQLAEVDMDVCVLCGRGISEDSPTDDAVDSGSIQAVVLPCLDVFCTDCFEPHKYEFDEAKDTNDGLRCPNAYCNITLSPQYVLIPKSYAESLINTPDDLTTQDTVFKNGYYGGPHTKTKQLLQDIAQMKKESLAFVEKGEPPLKCVVFSEFTSHLDLIGKALLDNGLNS